MNWENEEKPPEALIDLLSLLREASFQFLMEAMKKEGLTGLVPAHGQILFPLFSQSGPIHLSDLVKSSGRAKSTVTGMATTLEKYGYLQRENCPSDKRSTHIMLTEKGKSVEKVFKEISYNLNNTIYRGISEKDRRLLMNILGQVEKNLYPWMNNSLDK